MALKVFDVAKQTVDPTIKMLVAGEPGTGKTRTASTWPNVLYVDMDDGLLSVRDRPVRGINIASIAELEEVKKGLDQPASEHARIFGSKVDTVVIDTLDELAKLVMRERLRSEGHATAQRDDWGYLGDTMRNLVRGFRNLDGINVILNVHLSSVEDSETGRVTYKPSIQGAFGGEVAGFVDIAVLLKSATVPSADGKTKVVTRHLQSMPDPQYPWLKDRSGSLPGRFEINFEDDYDRLRDLIFGALFRDTKQEALEVAKELKGTKSKAKKAAPKPAATETQTGDAEATDEDRAEQEALQAKAAEEKAKVEAAQAEEEARIAAEAEAAAAAAEREPDALDEATTVEEANEALEAMEESTAGSADDDGDDELAKAEAALEAIKAKKAAAAAAAEAPAPEPEPDPEPTPAPEPDPVETAVTPPTPEPEPEPQADASALPPCAECGKIVENKDYADLSKIRFKKPLCREHFAAAKKG